MDGGLKQQKYSQPNTVSFVFCRASIPHIAVFESCPYYNINHWFNGVLLLVCLVTVWQVAYLLQLQPLWIWEYEVIRAQY